MNKRSLKTILTILFSIICIQGFNQNSIPDVTIKTIDGATVSSTSFANDGDPYLICFWKSCCNSSVKFMEALNEVYPDLVEDYNIKVFAISIDDSRSSDKVKPFVNGNAWEFDFFLDVNQDLARAMNVSLTPHCMVYDGENKLIWQKTVCMEGDEYIIEEELSKVSE